VGEFVAVLVNGERRSLELPAHTGTVANALDRLDEWIATTDGGWVNKQHIVEVRARSPGEQGVEEPLVTEVETSASRDPAG
jgi:hypothetical protein